MAAKELRTFADIYNAVADKLKVQTSDTVTINRIKRDINIIYNDVVSRDDWYWARKKVKLNQNKIYQSGTVSLTEGSRSGTFSAAPSTSMKGCLFATNDFSEVYKIVSHSAGGTSFTLDTTFKGATIAQATYKIWQDGLPLPTDCDEAYKVWHDHHEASMDPVADNQFLDLILNQPRREGRPRWFRVTDYEDPVMYSEISGLPVLSTRESDEYVRKLTFSADVSDLLEIGDRINVDLAGAEEYNGDYVVQNVETTVVTYIGRDKLEESATADLNLELKIQDDRETHEAYRKLEIYPYLSQDNTTINVEYVFKVAPLENDSDEPIMPLRDRSVLLHGALKEAWGRIRNTEEAANAAAEYETKIAKMAGNMQKSMDNPVLKSSQIYLAGKRKGRRRRFRNF